MHRQKTKTEDKRQLTPAGLQYLPNLAESSALGSKQHLSPFKLNRENRENSISKKKKKKSK